MNFATPTPSRQHARGHAVHRRALRPARVLVAWTALAVLASPVALAAEDESWTLTASQALARDDNLYRLPDGAQPGRGGRADTLATTTLGARWTPRFGRQSLDAAAAVRALRHDRHGALDHNGHDLRLALEAETVGRLGGELSLRHTRQLRPFDSLSAGGQPLRNLETDRVAGAVARLGGDGPLTLEAGLGAREFDLSRPTAGTSGLRSHTVSAGLRWRPAAATTVGAALRRTSGRYPALDEAWRLDALDLSAEWDRGGRSRAWVRLSPVRLRHDLLRQRDITGLTAAVQGRWEATPKTALELRLQREIGTDVGLERWGRAAGVVWPGTGDDARVLRRIALDVRHALTAKVSLSAGASHSRRDLVALDPLATTATGKDRTSRLAVGARWQATARIGAGCEAGVERRRVAGTLSSPYTARTVGCLLQFTF